jgi:hypothetical protein
MAASVRRVAVDDVSLDPAAACGTILAVMEMIGKSRALPPRTATEAA